MGKSEIITVYACYTRFVYNIYRHISRCAITIAKYKQLTLILCLPMHSPVDELLWKPSRHEHLYEPWVFSQTSNSLHGLSLHSSISVVKNIQGIYLLLIKKAGNTLILHPFLFAQPSYLPLQLL